MKMTRREFGIAMLLGIGAMFFSKIFARLFGQRSFGSQYVSARHWRRGDHLAG